MLILFDWDGTLAKKEIAEEAALRRLSFLGVTKSRAWIKKAQLTHAHYDVTKEAINQYTGVDNEIMLLTMMTNLFQLHYLAVVNEQKAKALYLHIHQLLEDIKQEFGVTYGIFTALRQDILEPALQTLGIRHLFTHVIGNTPDLRYNKTDLAKMIAVKEKPFLIIGDRKDDLLAGKELNVKTAIARWGHGMKEDSQYADYILENPKDLTKILRELLKKKQ